MEANQWILDALDTLMGLHLIDADRLWLQRPQHDRPSGC
jgi:hypothetical protein